MSSDAVQLVAQLGGELVTYEPYGGTAKTFKAIVERQPSQVQSSPAGAFPVNQLEVLIPMDATDGMTAIQVRKDRLRFKKNLGDSQESEFTVQKILQEDTGLAGSGGMFRLLVQC